MNNTNTLLLKLVERARQFAPLPRDDINRKLAVCPRSMSLQHYIFGQVEHNCYAVDLVRLGKGYKFSSRRRLNISRIHNCQSTAFQPLGDDGVDEFERLLGNRLVIFVIRDKRTAVVG
nr:hypothetical protein [Cupriavidus necator]